MVKPLARATSTPSPVGGLNDRDSLASMKPTDAVLMDNWWPYPSYVALRKGRLVHVYGFSSAVETLVEYLPTSGASQLFAAAGTSVYDVTNPGPLGAAVLSGMANARWQDVSITTPGGSFLYLVNGVDNPQLWNGTTWQGVTNASAPVSITGVDPSTFVHGTLFKNRIYFVESNSMQVWYLPTNAVGGAAQVIDLGSIFRLGGAIMAVYTWTIDSGDGSDDHLVIISTNGEVAVYSGTDPSTAATWNLIGNFVLGRPLGRRCATKMGGDLAVNTTEGVFPLGKGLISSTVNRAVALTDKIQNSVSQAALTLGSNFGWQVELFPDATMLVLNVPAGNGQNYQFAQNTITGAWGKFLNWNASVWKNASTGLYFGDNTAVYRAWQSDTDQARVGSEFVSVPINGDILPAFSYFGLRASNKYFTMVRPYLMTSGTPSILYSLNVNYELREPQGALSYTPPMGMVWGQMFWGSMVWGGGFTSLTNWQTVGDVANSASLRMRVQGNGAEVRFTNTDFAFQTGGLL